MHESKPAVLMEHVENGYEIMVQLEDGNADGRIVRERRENGDRD